MREKPGDRLVAGGRVPVVLELLAPDEDEEEPSMFPVDELLPSSSVVELELESRPVAEIVVTGEVVSSPVELEAASVSFPPGSSAPAHPQGVIVNVSANPKNEDLMS